MGHEKSKTVTLRRGGKTRHANIDTVGKDAGRTLGGRDFRTMNDALIEAETRSSMAERTGPIGHHRPAGTTPRSAAQRKNPRDRNRPTNPRLRRK